MSKELINAAKLIKEECSKHKDCIGCFYNTVSEDCVVDNYEYSPSQWDLLELEEKND